ncbi:MAG TPA: hypothetical protein VHF23_10535 [Gaiellaceae bacterium]|nr:hypothetical protein [Gaiellaceae bacterium]
MPAGLSLAELRSLAEAQGVAPSDDDLETVRGMLAALRFEEIERLVAPDTVPAGLFLPAEGE